MDTDNVITLKQERARAFTELRQMVDAAEAENRDLNADEQQKYDNIGAGIRSLDARLKRIEEVRETAAKAERFHNQLDGNPGAGERRNDAAGLLSREYRDAFDQYLRFGAADMDAEQRSILAMGQRSAQAPETRDGMVIGTGSLGGFAVPQDFSDRLFSLKVQAGGVRQTKVNVFRTSGGNPMPVPIATAHGAATWLAETSAASSADETLAQVTLNAYVSLRLEKLSIQLLADAAFDLGAFVTDIIGQKVARLQNAAYINGSGSTQPTGMINQAGVASLVTASHTTIAPDEVVNFLYQIIPPYRINGEFLVADSALQVISTLKATTNQYLFIPSLRDGVPDQLLGKPIYNEPDLQAVGAINNVVAMFADWNNFYTIRDVNEFNVQRLNERYADTLQVGFLGWQRTDGHVIDTAAGAQLKMSAT